jgi:hypothetical protein
LLLINFTANLTVLCSAVGRTLSAITYGLNVKSADEVGCTRPQLSVMGDILTISPVHWQYMVEVEAVIKMTMDALVSGAHLVDLLPFRMSMQSCCSPSFLILRPVQSNTSRNGCHLQHSIKKPIPADDSLTV